MSEAREQDLYEVLQVSPRADQETLERVFRHLAKRYHPDHEGGDATLFSELVEAYRILSDPEKRAEYDARYPRIREQNWRIFDQDSAGDMNQRVAMLELAPPAAGPSDIAASAASVDGR